MIMTRMTALLLAALLLVPVACTKQREQAGPVTLQIVTTLFPLYDFVRIIGRDAVTVKLLLPPGMEAHGFEPRPEDMVSMAKADLFIYTNPEMEPWAEKLAGSIVKAGKPGLVAAGDGAAYLTVSPAAHGDHHKSEHRHSSRDPHIWLNLNNAIVMVDNITRAMAVALPAKAGMFEANAAAYKDTLRALDRRYQSGLSGCATREFIHGGHYAFAYLADRYGLAYVSAYGISADSEPSPGTLIALTNRLRALDVRSLFYEELMSPRIAETIAKETGASLVRLHAVHNLTKQEFESGATFTGLMEKNLAALRQGLGCR